MSQPNAFDQLRPIPPPSSWPTNGPSAPTHDPELGRPGPAIDLDHLDDSVDVMLNDAAVADDVPLTGGRQRARPGFWLYCCSIFMLLVFLVGVGFPIFSTVYTTYRLIWDTEYYTPEQYGVIYMICLKMGLWSIFLLTTSQNSCIQFLSSISIFVHLSVWDFAHRGGFFNIPSAHKDLNYHVAYFLFYAFIISYIVFAVLFVLFIFLILGLYCWDRRRRAQQQIANRSILSQIAKITRRDWIGKHTPEEVEKERARSLDNCCICYSPIGDESFLAEIPVCKHIFHHSCVMQWLDKNPTCPICRDNVVKNMQSGGGRVVMS